MPHTAKEIADAQAKANLIAQALARLSDSTKTLTNDVVTSLVTLAQGTTAYGYLQLDEQRRWIQAQNEGRHFLAVAALTKRLADLANLVDQYNSQLIDIRRWLKVGSAEELAAAVAAGKTVETGTFVAAGYSDEQIAEIKARAIERARAFHGQK